MRVARFAAALALLATALLLAPAREAPAYSGVGRIAVERALGRVPASPEELDQAIQELETKLRGGDRSAPTAYAAAVLKLNRPRAVSLDEPRRLLADALVADAGWEDALELWTDLVPPDAELRAAAERLREAGAAGAASAWALARVLHLLEKYDDAGQAAERAAAADPAYRARALWLQAVMAGERKDDDRATRHFLDALDALDDPAAELVWRNALLVASPEEIERHKQTVSESRADFFRSFWKRRDVFPLTETNERLGEHFRRLKKARDSYALRSNGRAYLTTHDAFKRLSPDLDFYSSDLVYDYQARIPLWLDHRGLVYVRHGEPDRVTRSSGGSEPDDRDLSRAPAARSETWLYARLTFKPLLFHFVDRHGVGEFVITLNLAQALAKTTLEDDPKHILGNTGNFQDLYATRATFHALFQRVAVSRSRYEIEDLLRQEASMMASFLREAWYDDTNGLLEKDDILPFAAYNANFRGRGEDVHAYVYYAIPERELKVKGQAAGAAALFEFDATIVIYTSSWAERIATAEHHFRYERPAGKKPAKDEFLVGALEIADVKPGRYNFAFQVTERHSGKIGIAKGQFVSDYWGPSFVNLSDLLLASRITPTDRDSVFERQGQRVVPIPTRMIKKGSKAEVYYEIYDLKPGADGKRHYRLETRVLQIQREPSIAEKILGIGMNIAGAFFPYPIFLARVGIFGLEIAASDPKRGLDTAVEERAATSTDAPVAETFAVDAGKYAPGVYQAYVTVKDYVTGSVSTRSIRFAVVD